MFTNIPSAALKELVKLSERKEALMAQIQEIDRQMVRVQRRLGVPTLRAKQGATVTVSRSGSGQFRRSRAPRRALKKKG